MFWEQMPNYLAFGMTADEYWNGEPNLATIYRKKYYININRRNQELWLQGLYFCDALSVVIGNAFGGKGGKKHKYLEKPLEIMPNTEAERKAVAQAERDKLVAQLDTWFNSWNSNHKDVKK